MKPQFDNIPKELTDLDQWIVFENRNGRDKVPRSARRGPAKVNDPSTWSDYETAKRAYERRGCQGIGFATSLADGLALLDFDDVVRDGRIPRNVSRWLKRFDSYVEVSPSGRGLHVIARGQLIDLPDDRTGWISDESGIRAEIYHDRRYFSITGDVWGDYDQIRDVDDDLLSEFVHEFFASRIESEAPQRHDPIDDEIDDPAIMPSVKNYLDDMPESVSGARGHDAMFAACCSIYRFGVSDDLAMEAAEYFNDEYCTPPWSDSELRRKLREAKKEVLQSNQFGTMDVCRSFLPPETDFESIEPVPRESEPPESEFPKRLLDVPGLLGELADLHAENAYCEQPVWAVSTAIAYCSALFGGKVSDDRGNYTNLYVINVGNSGSGKERGNQVIKRLGGDFVTGNFTSEAACFATLEFGAVRLSMLDEVARFLKTAQDERRNPQEYGLITTWLTLFGDHGPIHSRNYADVNKAFLVEFAHLSLYGSCTPSDLFSVFDESSFKNGFVPRLLVFRGEQRGKTDQWIKAAIRPARSTRIAIKYWKNPDLLDHKTFLGYTGGARKVFDDLLAHVTTEREKNPPYTDAMWSRAIQKAARLATIYQMAMDRKSTRIELAAAKWACDLVEFLSRDVLLATEANAPMSEFERIQAKIVEFVCSGTGYKTRSEICRSKFGRKLHPLTRKSVLENIVETGLVGVANLKKNEGRKSAQYLFDPKAHTLKSIRSALK